MASHSLHNIYTIEFHDKEEIHLLDTFLKAMKVKFNKKEISSKSEFVMEPSAYYELMKDSLKDVGKHPKMNAEEMTKFLNDL